MGEFTLDTSDEVVLPYPHLHPRPRGYRWSDLSPFTQGYIEALFASLPKREPTTRECALAGEDRLEDISLTQAFINGANGRSHRNRGRRAWLAAHATGRTWRQAFDIEQNRRRFSDLAPETLARIIADCEAYRAERDANWGAERSWTREHGGDFWGSRDGGAWINFPPLTPYLGDDGRVYLREASDERTG